MAGVVREIWRYPAKSMLGDRVERAELLGHGMVGDRMWAVRDGVRGGIRGAKKISGLMRLSARYLVERGNPESSPSTIPRASSRRSTG